MERRLSRLAVLALALVPLAQGALAEDPPPADERTKLELEKREAIRHGVESLKGQQKPDGTYTYLDRPFGGIPDRQVQGSTALAALALLKAGASPDDPVVKKAFDAIVGLPVTHCYAAGCVLLAIDALFAWTPDAPDPGAPPGEGTREKKPVAGGGKKAKRDPRLLDLAKQCVAFLERSQQKGLWRYPFPSGSSEDVSVAQYALLGLDAAERLGLTVKPEVYEKAVEYLVREQEKSGPEVAPFTVPAAEHTFKELRAIEKELRDKIHKIDASSKGKPDGEARAEEEKRLAEEEAGRRIYRTGEKDRAKLEKMFARGWRYMAEGLDVFGNPLGPGAKGPPTDPPTGAMTASALACLFTCKAHLDGTPAWEKRRKEVDKALRDGAAWLAKHYTVEKNPESALHHYYYLYSLERAAILGLIPRLGEKDWYDDGVKLFVAKQKGDGSWDAERAGTCGPMPDTCFALLFLARGTVPAVRLPERTTTGGGAARK